MKSFSLGHPANVIRTGVHVYHTPNGILNSIVCLHSEALLKAMNISLLGHVERFIMWTQRSSHRQRGCKMGLLQIASLDPVPHCLIPVALLWACLCYVPLPHLALLALPTHRRWTTSAPRLSSCTLFTCAVSGEPWGLWAERELSRASSLAFSRFCRAVLGGGARDRRDLASPCGPWFLENRWFGGVREGQWLQQAPPLWVRG